MRNTKKMKRVYQRLLYEEHVLRRLFQGLPGLIVFGVCLTTGYLEYPISSFRSIEYELRNTLRTADWYNAGIPILELPSDHAIGNSTRVVLAKGGNARQLRGQLVYSATSVVVPCPYIEKPILKAIMARNASSCLNSTCAQLAELCRSDSAFVEAGTTGKFIDYQHGYIPVTVVTNGSYTNASNASIIVSLSLWETPYENIISVAETRLEVGTLRENPKPFVRSFKRTSSDPFYLKLTLAALSLSVLQIVIDVAVFREPRNSHWGKSETRFLHQVIPCLTSMFMTTVLTFKYFLATEKGNLFSNWRSIVSSLESPSGMGISPVQTLTVFNEIMVTAYWLDLLRAATISGLWLLLLRTVIYMSAHPRMAILTDTLRKGFERLIYFFFIYVGLLFGFAMAYVVAIDDRYALTQAVLRLGGFILGNPDFKAETVLQTIYALLFGILMCITGLYWLLGLAVSAYEEYLRDLAKIKHIVPPVWEDARIIVTEFFVSLSDNWPSRHAALDAMSGRKAIPDPAKLKAMIDWYAKQLPSSRQVSMQTEIKSMQDFVKREFQERFKRARDSVIRQELDKIDHCLRYIQTKANLSSYECVHVFI